HVLVSFLKQRFENEFEKGRLAWVWNRGGRTYDHQPIHVLPLHGLDHVRYSGGIKGRRTTAFHGVCPRSNRPNYCVAAAHRVLNGRCIKDVGGFYSALPCWNIDALGITGHGSYTMTSGNGFLYQLLTSPAGCAKNHQFHRVYASTLGLPRKAYFGSYLP